MITGILAPLGPGAMLTTTPLGRGGLVKGGPAGGDDGARVGTGAEADVGTADEIRVGARVVEGTRVAEGSEMGPIETNTDGTGTPLGRITGPGAKT